MHQRLRQLSEATPYTPEMLLGQGGAGAVYAAEDRRTGGKVAMKVMLSPHPRGILRFKQEFRVLSQRHHPNLVQMYELGCAEGHWYYTMELVEGQTLLDVLLPDQHDDDERTPTSSSTHISPLNTPQHRPFDTLDHGDAQDDAWSQGPACDLEALEGMLGQLLDALEFLHSQGIVHRDLKPSNILVDLNGNVRILDFGLALEHEATRGISLDGTVVGTPAYLSPEQCKGEPATTASDMYALGCILFKLLSGRLPFPGDANTTMLARITQPPPLIHRRVPNLPQQLAHVCNALLNPDPALRPTPAQVRELLRLASPSAITSNPMLPTRNESAVELVGRNAEQEALGGLIERAKGGELGLGVMVGESGLGKSALAQWTIDKARADGFLVLAGRCYEREQLPFTAFDAVLDATVLALAQLKPRQRAAIKRSLARLVRFFPAFEMLSDDTAPDLTPPPDNPKAQYIEAANSLGAVFEHLQLAQPLLIVLDDLQWADTESIDLLLALIHTFSAHRVFVLALVRPAGTAAPHPTARLMGLVERLEGAVTLRLGPLSHDDASQAAKALVSDPGLCERLAVLGAGNPFLTQRLAYLLQRLDPDQRAAVLEEAHDDQRLLQRLLDHVSDDAQHLLNIAATAGGPIDAELFKTLSALDPQAHKQALDQLLTTRLLKTHSSDEERYDLYHDRIRNAAYTRLAPEARADLHRAFALAIEARTSASGELTAHRRDVEALVRHWRAAGERERTHTSALEAAQRAEAYLAFERAAALLRLAIEHAPPETSDATIAARWEHIGELHEYAGHNARACEAYTHALERWLALDTAHPERHLASLRMRSKLGRTLVNTNQNQEARQVFNDAADQLGITLDHSLPRLVVLIIALRLRALFRKLVSPSTPTPVQVESLNFLNITYTHMLFMWPMVALAAREHARLLNHTTNDPTTHFRNLLQESVDKLLMSRPTQQNLDRVTALIDAAEAIAHDHNIPHAHAHVQSHRALRWFFSDLDRSKLLYEDAHASFERGGLIDSVDYRIIQSQYIITLVARGDHDLVEQKYARYTRNPLQTNTAITLNVHINQSKIHMLRGDAARAAECNRLAAALVERQPESLLSHLRAAVLQHTLMAQGDFQGVLDLTQHHRDPRYNPPNPLSFPRVMWAEQELHACIGLLRQGRLSAAQARYARKLIRRLQKYTVLGYDAQGLATAAMLDHAEGKTKRATQTMRRALRASSTQCTPYNRWAVLTAANELGLLTRDLETELEAITRRCGYNPLYLNPPA